MAQAQARPRPQVMKVTDAAAARIAELMARGEGVGLRVGVKNGGCAGMEYTMDFVTAAGPMDEVVEQDGARVIVPPMAQMFLIGTEMDFVEEKFKSGFVFNNPNAKGTCGCGESFSV